jgi:predicted RNA binding protein YcfA (HicA-like mRNA interferase family)
VKLPRDLSGDELIRALTRFGYVSVRQTGSHVRMKATDGTDFPVSVPRHDRLKVGTLSGILDDVAGHAGISVEELRDRLGI